MRRKTRRKRCEFCNELLNPPFHKDTVCHECDKELQVYTDQKLKREQEHTHKRKCKGCGAGLDISRWWYCFTCKPPSENIQLDEDFLYCSTIENFQ